MLNLGHYIKWLWLLEKLTEECITLSYCIKIQQTSSCGCVYSCVDLCIQEHRCLEAMGSGGQPIQLKHITDWSHAGRIIKDLPVNHSFFNATLYGADDRLDDIHNRLTWCTLLSQNDFYLNSELKEHQHHPIDVSPSRSGSISIPDKTFPVFTVLKDQSLHEWSCSFFFVFVSK